MNMKWLMSLLYCILHIFSDHSKRICLHILLYKTCQAKIKSWTSSLAKISFILFNERSISSSMFNSFTISVHGKNKRKMKTFPQSIEPLTPTTLVTSTYENRPMFDSPQSPSALWLCPLPLGIQLYIWTSQ